MVQGWFNINYNHTGKLDWHDHGGPYAPYFHGYYSVNAEPSITYYNVFGNEVKSLKTVKPFKVNTVREAIDICEYGIEKNFVVFVNDKKYIPMKGLGRTIDLNKEVA
jgi:hypothetical protein